MEIEEKVKLAKLTEISIAKAREVYRPVATRSSLVFFLIDNLNALDRVYHYSMANFVFVLKKGMDITPGGSDESKVGVTKELRMVAQECKVREGERGEGTCTQVLVPWEGGST